MISKKDHHLARFFEIRDQLDRLRIPLESIIDLIHDDEDLIRSEALDYAIVHRMRLPPQVLRRALHNEKSKLVFPRLWVSLAMAQRSQAFAFLKREQRSRQMGEFEKAYMSAALYICTESKHYEYRLASFLFSSDIFAAYSSVDLLGLISGDRPELLRVLLLDLKKANLEVYRKASKLFETRLR